MVISDRLSAGFHNLLRKAGTQVKIEYYNQVFDNVYDDQVTLILSGTLWTSGIILPINKRQGSTDSVLVEQGKLQDKDKRLYVTGSTDMTGEELSIKIQIGSPTGDVYSTIPLGAIQYETLGTDIYKRQYIRYLQTGSL